jgi:hypothetical protein
VCVHVAIVSTSLTSYLGLLACSMYLDAQLEIPSAAHASRLFKALQGVAKPRVAVPLDPVLRRRLEALTVQWVASDWLSSIGLPQLGGA